MSTCTGSIFNTKQGVYFGTKIDNGVMHVVVSDQKSASSWTIVESTMPSEGVAVPKFNIMENGTELYMDLMSKDDKVYVILTKDSTKQSSIFYFYRSGYGAEDIRNFFFRSVVNQWVITSSGKSGEYITLEKFNGNDDKQKFLYDFYAKSVFK